MKRRLAFAAAVCLSASAAQAAAAQCSGPMPARLEAGRHWVSARDVACWLGGVKLVGASSTSAVLRSKQARVKLQLGSKIATTGEVGAQRSVHMQHAPVQRAGQLLLPLEELAYLLGKPLPRLRSTIISPAGSEAASASSSTQAVTLSPSTVSPGAAASSSTAPASPTVHASSTAPASSTSAAINPPGDALEALDPASVARLLQNPRSWLRTGVVTQDGLVDLQVAHLPARGYRASPKSPRQDATAWNELSMARNCLAQTGRGSGAARVISSQEDALVLLAEGSCYYERQGQRAWRVKG